MTERRFNPFAVMPLLHRLAGIRTRSLLLIVPVVVGLVVGATFIEGTTGSLSDFRLLRDAQVALGTTDDTASPPNFPLIRDFTSIWLLTAIVLTFLLVHRQWRLMAECVRTIELNGAITARAKPLPSRLLSAGERLFPAKSPDPDALETVMRHARQYTQVICTHFAWVLAICAGLAMVLLMLGEYNVDLFEVVAPTEISERARLDWLTKAYESWWAGFDHPIGAGVYLAVGVFALFVVLMQNVIGLACIYFVLVLPKVARIDADWFNRDGLYGWRPIAMVFRTVYWSLVLHGATLAVLLIALGPTHLVWISPFLISWLIVAPLYIGGSFSIFRRVERIARARRVGRIEGEMQTAGLGAESPSVSLMPFSSELARTVAARIRPLRLGTWGWSFAIFTYIVPLGLTTFQLFAG